MKIVVTLQNLLLLGEGVSIKVPKSEPYLDHIFLMVLGESGDSRVTDKRVGDLLENPDRYIEKIVQKHLKIEKLKKL